MDLRATIVAYTPVNDQEASDKRLMLAAFDAFDDLLTRQNAFMHFTASAWIVNGARTKALLAYHNIYDSWAWTGGHADGDADLLNVALREAREETGLAQVTPLIKAPISLEILPVQAHVKRGAFVSPHLHLNLTYALLADENAPLKSKPDENAAVKWFTLAEALTVGREEEMRPIYQKLNEAVGLLNASKDQ